MTIIEIGTEEQATGKAYCCKICDRIEEIEPAFNHQYE